MAVAAKKPIIDRVIEVVQKKLLANEVSMKVLAEQDKIFDSGIKPEVERFYNHSLGAYVIGITDLRKVMDESCAQGANIGTYFATKNAYSDMLYALQAIKGK